MAAVRDGHGTPASPDVSADGPRVPSKAPQVWNESPSLDYERVDIPGTHVPIWMVIGIVAGVVVLLAGTAFLLLR